MTDKQKLVILEGIVITTEVLLASEHLEHKLHRDQLLDLIQKTRKELKDAEKKEKTS